MQLNSILHLTGELLQGSGESPSDDSADTLALLPFAAVLSGAFSLVAPIQEAGAEQAQTLEVAAEGDDAPGPARQPLQLLDLDGIDPSFVSFTSSLLMPSSRLLGFMCLRRFITTLSQKMIPPAGCCVSGAANDERTSHQRVGWWAMFCTCPWRCESLSPKAGNTDCGCRRLSRRMPAID